MKSMALETALGTERQEPRTKEVVVVPVREVAESINWTSGMARETEYESENVLEGG